MEKLSLQGIGAKSLMLLLLSWSSCTERNEVKLLFEQVASERSLARVHSLRTLLKSAKHGWRVDYQPNKKVGQFSFLFKFLTDSVVQTHSDLSTGDLTPVRSEYDIIQGAATKLSFVTQSPIHKLSDSEYYNALPNAAGSGLKGSFEFLYYGLAENGEDLIFRADRGLDTLLFKRASPSYIDTLSAHLISLDTLKGVVARKGKHSFSAIISATKSYASDQIFSSSRITDVDFIARNLSIYRISMVEGLPKWHDPYVSGFRLTPTGIRIINLEAPEKRAIKDLALAYNHVENEYQGLLGASKGVILGYNYYSALYHKDLVNLVSNISSSTFLSYDPALSSTGDALDIGAQTIFNSLLKVYKDYINHDVIPEEVKKKEKKHTIRVGTFAPESIEIRLRVVAAIQLQLGEHSAYLLLHAQIARLVVAPRMLPIVLEQQHVVTPYRLHLRAEKNRLFMDLPAGLSVDETFEDLALESSVNKVLTFLTDKEGFFVDKQQKENKNKIITYTLINTKDSSLKLPLTVKPYNIEYKIVN